MFDTEAKNKGIDFKIYKIDLSIFVIFASSAEFSSKSTLTDARGFKKNQMNLQPLAGIIRINKDKSYEEENSDKYFEAVFIHGMSNVLGFSSTFFRVLFGEYMNLAQENFE